MYPRLRVVSLGHEFEQLILGSKQLSASVVRISIYLSWKSLSLSAKFLSWFFIPPKMVIRTAPGESEEVYRKFEVGHCGVHQHPPSLK